jgi:hypothetical protein
MRWSGYTYIKKNKIKFISNLSSFDIIRYTTVNIIINTFVFLLIVRNEKYLAYKSAININLLWKIETNSKIAFQTWQGQVQGRLIKEETQELQSYYITMSSGL